ncbi:MAG: response regulator [Flavisolibacter sp.]
MDIGDTKRFIIYAEDDLDDFDAIKEALDQLTHNYTLIHAKDGTDVITFLQGENLIPDLIVLDLNMPIMDGKEVLLWLKERHRFKEIPVMIFTTSSREEDLKLCLKYQCTFFRKPTLYRDLLHIVQTMVQMAETGVKK